MTKRNYFLGFLVVAVVSAFAACGGGGGAGGGLTPSSPGKPGSPTSSATKGATFHIVIPQKTSGSSSVRRPNFISTDTASFQVVVSEVNGAPPNPQPTPLVVNLQTSPFCTGYGTANVSCTIIVNVPVATSVQLELLSYDASGNLIGQATIGPINTTLPTIPAQNISVGGVPATVAISRSVMSGPDNGGTSTTTFYVTAKDADGNVIVQPGTYPSPIALSVSGDPNGSISLTPSTLNSPGPDNGQNQITISYNSTKALTGVATITATSGSNTATASFAPLVVSPGTLTQMFSGGSTQTLTVSEPGYSGAFTFTGPTTSGLATVSCAPSNCTPPSGGSVTISVSPGSTTGNDNIFINDANGGQFPVPLSVTSTTGGGPLVVASPAIYTYATTTGGKNAGITTGPDGASIWFLDENNSKIGAVANPGACNSSSCGIVESVMPTTAPVATLISITAAADGNIYAVSTGDGETDLGTFFQLTNCSPSNASCGIGYQTNLSDSFDCGCYVAPTAVFAAPDGNLYASASQPAFEASYSGIIWEPIPGCCQYFNDVEVGGSPDSINQLAMDSSDNLWFTDLGTANVGFVNMQQCLYSCTATEQPIGTATSAPMNYGPEGGAHQRSPGLPIRVSHAIRQPKFAPKPLPHRFLTPTTSTFSAPQGIVAGPDGNMYVADPGNHTIDQIPTVTWTSLSCTSNCLFAPIALPIGGAQPQSLVVGPDSNIWFTDTSGYIGVVLLGQCTSTCPVKEYSTGSVRPLGITVGPDGNIWFTDAAANHIGKVVLQ